MSKIPALIISNLDSDLYKLNKFINKIKIKKMGTLIIHCIFEEATIKKPVQIYKKIKQNVILNFYSRELIVRSIESAIIAQSAPGTGSIIINKFDILNYD